MPTQTHLMSWIAWFISLLADQLNSNTICLASRANESDVPNNEIQHFKVLAFPELERNGNRMMVTQSDFFLKPAPSLVFELLMPQFCIHMFLQKGRQLVILTPGGNDSEHCHFLCTYCQASTRACGIRSDPITRGSNPRDLLLKSTFYWLISKYLKLFWNIFETKGRKNLQVHTSLKKMLRWWPQTQ